MEIESSEFRNMVAPIARSFKLRGKMGVNTNLTPDAGIALATYIDRLARMLDLQADILASQQRVRKMESRLLREWIKLVGGIALWVAGLFLLSWVAERLAG